MPKNLQSTIKRWTPFSSMINTDPDDLHLRRKNHTGVISPDCDPAADPLGILIACENAETFPEDRRSPHRLDDKTFALIPKTADPFFSLDEDTGQYPQANAYHCSANMAALAASNLGKVHPVTRGHFSVHDYWA